MKYPQGCVFTDWRLTYSAPRKGAAKQAYVRRTVTLPDGTRKNDFCPVEEYAEFRGDEQALKDFVTRKNDRLPEAEKARAKVEIKHSFTHPELVDLFISELKTNIETKDATVLGNYLKRYVIGFFSDRLKLMDPIKWHKNQALWAQALLNEFTDEEISSRKEEGIKRLRLWPDGKIPSDSTVKKIIQVTNEFVGWLHQRNPDEYPPLVFEPLKRARFKKLRATRKALDLVRVRRYIPDAVWEEIYTEIQKDKYRNIKGQVCLGYYFGDRVAETGATTHDDLHEDHLRTQWQVSKIQKTPSGDREIVKAVVKGRMDRRVEFWFPGWKPKGGLTARNVYDWISFIQSHPMHPDTLGRKWALLMAALGIPFQFHDLRRTFITNSFRIGKFNNHEVLPGDIQLAAGHVNITTTMRYKLDPRALSEKKYNPKNDVVDSDRDED